MKRWNLKKIVWFQWEFGIRRKSPAYEKNKKKSNLSIFILLKKIINEIASAKLSCDSKTKDTAWINSERLLKFLFDFIDIWWKSYQPLNNVSNSTQFSGNFSKIDEKCAISHCLMTTTQQCLLLKYARFRFCLKYKSWLCHIQSANCDSSKITSYHIDFLLYKCIPTTTNNNNIC